MDFNTIHWKTEERIGHLAMAQPPANTMNRMFFHELNLLTTEVMPGSGIKALVVYGTGRHFSAGADPADLCRQVRETLPINYPEEIPSFLSLARESFQFIENLTIPTLAAIRGVCLGSALELALCCKFRLCAGGSVMGFPESTFGLMTGLGGSVRLPGIVGRQKAIELILGGRNITSEVAFDLGLVHRIMPRRTLIDDTLQLARTMISNDQ